MQSSPPAQPRDTRAKVNQCGLLIWHQPEIPKIKTVSVETVGFAIFENVKEVSVEKESFRSFPLAGATPRVGQRCFPAYASRLRLLHQLTKNVRTGRSCTDDFGFHGPRSPFQPPPLKWGSELRTPEKCHAIILIFIHLCMCWQGNRNRGV